jgi:hypothetical protein
LDHARRYANGSVRRLRWGCPMCAASAGIRKTTTDLESNGFVIASMSATSYADFVNEATNLLLSESVVVI